MLMETKLISQVEEKTGTDYEPYNTKNEDTKLVLNENVLAMIEDLLLEIDRLEEEIEDMREYYEAHYRYVREDIPDCER